jgi:hypothetical protein
MISYWLGEMFEVTLQARVEGVGAKEPGVRIPIGEQNKTIGSKLRNILPKN